MIKLPHRSFWQALGRYDPCAHFATQVKEDHARFFDARHDVLGLYADEAERRAREGSATYVLAEHVDILNRRVGQPGLPRGGRAHWLR